MPWSLKPSQVIQSLPENHGAGASEDISVHLCFICLLHLCNEKGLQLTNAGQLNSLNIHIPTA